MAENSGMKKSRTIPVAVVALLALMLVVTFVSYNGLASSKNSTEKAWSDVETAYQRRADLIPNLVAIAEQSSIREQTILTEVVDARAKSLETSVEMGDTEELTASQSEVGASINRLLAISEDYPEIQSNQNWIELQAQVEGTENRIATARRDYNDVVEKYNAKIVTFPSSIVASLFNFEKESYFKSNERAEKAPQLDFRDSKVK